MSHKRTLIRNELVSILQAANTSAGSRIYGDRVLPLFDETYPLIMVYARDESVSSQGSTPFPAKRTLPIFVEIRVTLNEGTSLDTSIDDICDQVEAATKANPRLNQKVIQMNLLSTEFDVLKDGEKILGGARLTYETVYTD